MKQIEEIPQKMKALNLHNVADLRLEEVETPNLLPDTVLLKINASGICSSDIERVFVTGTYHFPTIPGHEFSGQIVAIGDNVDNSFLGKRACVFPVLPCMQCEACQKEEYALCSNYSYFGSRCDGGFAQYLVVPTWNLIPFEDSLDYEVAALCEPAAVSLHATRLAQIKENDTVAIIGSGTIGFLIGKFAKLQGAKVIMFLRREEAAQFAKKQGFIPILEKEEYMQKFSEITNRQGANIVFEAVGTNSAIETAIQTVGTMGTVILVGNPKGNVQLEKSIYWKILRKQLTIKGSWNSNYSKSKNDWIDVLKIMKNNMQEFRELITHTFTLDQSEEAFQLVKSDTFKLKVTFKIGGK